MSYLQQATKNQCGRPIRKEYLENTTKSVEGLFGTIGALVGNSLDKSCNYIAQDVGYVAGYFVGVWINTPRANNLRKATEWQ